MRGGQCKSDVAVVDVDDIDFDQGSQFGEETVQAPWGRTHDRIGGALLLLLANAEWAASGFGNK